jgi:hypothetical protein
MFHRVLKLLETRFQFKISFPHINTTSDEPHVIEAFILDMDSKQRAGNILAPY